jgi:DNA-binding transcriptional regulator YhcF (GntR family)
MQGRINTTFGTYQADLFESGLVAEIGANAFAVWCAIKAHSDFNNGVSWPSIRRLMRQTGLASATVQRALSGLEKSYLLRSTVKGQRRYYVARERLDVKLGDRTLCTIVVDYVPKILRHRLTQIKAALESGEGKANVFCPFGQ